MESKYVSFQWKSHSMKKKTTIKGRQTAAWMFAHMCEVRIFSEVELSVELHWFLAVWRLFEGDTRLNTRKN